MRVQNRHIIYVQGYDPRGLARYYRMFRSELRKFERLYQIKTTISRPQDSGDGEIASWSIDSEGDDWRTHTRYDFLRFEDFIKRDLAQPIWKTVLAGVLVYWQLVFRGTLARFAMANWRFAAFVTYPYFVLLLETLFAGAVGWLFAAGLTALGLPQVFGAVAAAALFVAVLGTTLKYTEEKTYLLYLMCDHAWTWEFSHRRQPDWDRRIDRFAEHLCRIARSSRAEEILLVGHSSGSFLAAEILARALKLDPALGRQGPRIMLLTIGSNYPVVGYHAAAQDFRDHLRDLAVEPSIDWVDCQARKDVMNFFHFDPITGHGIDVADARCNPTIVTVRFREIIAPEHYNLFRWQFFRVHFQFVMANQRPHAYDFFMIVCGPVPLRERMAMPDAALAIATGDQRAREFAWRRLDRDNISRSSQNTAQELGKLEPPARNRG